jgi:hypothetical protein
MSPDPQVLFSRRSQGGATQVVQGLQVPDVLTQAAGTDTHKEMYEPPIATDRFTHLLDGTFFTLKVVLPWEYQVSVDGSDFGFSPALTAMT